MVSTCDGLFFLGLGRNKTEVANSCHILATYMNLALRLYLVIKLCYKNNNMFLLLKIHLIYDKLKISKF